MSGSADPIRQLWSRRLTGQPLNDTEQRLLQAALRDDPDLRSELSDDATSHALLVALHDVPQTEEEFVQAVLQRTQHANVADSNTPPVATPTVTTPLPRTAADVPASSGQPPAIAPTSGTPGPVGLPEPHELPVLKGHSSHTKLRGNSHRRSRQGTSLLLTALLFVSLGLIFWFQGGIGPQMAGTSAPEKQPENVNPPDSLPVAPQEPVSLADQRDLETQEAPKALPNPTLQEPPPPAVLVTGNDPPGMPEPDQVPGPEVPNSPPAGIEDGSPFVTLTAMDNPVWERDDRVGARWNSERVRLFGGTIELTFDDGAIVRLTGPVDFQPQAVDLLDLRRGQLSAFVPSAAVGFTVQTPSSEVVDLGTEFEVSVKDTGASDVILRTGEVEVTPSRQNNESQRKWQLTSDGFQQASFLAMPQGPDRAAFAVKVQGADGQFQGVISMGGRTAEFQSPETFDNVHQRVMTQLATSQESTQRQWQDFVQSMQQSMRGSLQFNGRQMRFGSFDEVMRLHQQLQSQPVGDGASFRGSINVNGKEIPFQTREEFEAARRAAFGAAASFGAGDLLKRQKRSGGER